MSNLAQVQFRLLGAIGLLSLLIVGCEGSNEACSIERHSPFAATLSPNNAVIPRYTNLNEFPVAFDVDAYHVTETNAAGFEFGVPDDGDRKMKIKSSHERWSILAPGMTVEYSVYWARARQFESSDLSKLQVKLGEPQNIPAEYSKITTHRASDEFPDRVPLCRPR